MIDAGSRVVEMDRHDGRRYPLPRMIGDRWLWRPMPDGPALELNLASLLERYDETKSMFEERERRRTAD